MIETVCSMLAVPAFLLMGAEDWKTFRIRDQYSLFVAFLGMVHALWAGIWGGVGEIVPYLAGAFLVSGPLYALFVVSEGRAIGGGDVKMTAAAGFLLGWQKMLLGFSVACILGSVIHGIRMKWTGCGKRLAFGPYLAAGIIFAMTMGNRVINWYGQFY